MWGFLTKNNSHGVGKVTFALFSSRGRAEIMRVLSFSFFVCARRKLAWCCIWPKGHDCGGPDSGTYFL